MYVHFDAIIQECLQNLLFFMYILINVYMYNIHVSNNYINLESA